MLLEKYAAFLAYYRASLQMYDTIVMVVELIPLFQHWGFVSPTALYTSDQNKNEPVISSGLNVGFHGIAIKVT
jgi:hypothetical protein